jgi:hypothetical protein
MEVIKKPVDIKEWRRECTCPRCQAGLRYEVSDIKYEPPGGDARDNWPESFSVFCAVCSQIISVEVNDLTEYIKHTIIQRYNCRSPFNER